MATTAESRLPTSEQETKIHRSVRVFAVAAIEKQKFASLLNNPPACWDDMPMVEIILAKTDDGITAIGGEIRNGNNLFHESMEVVADKTLLTRESYRNLEGTATVWHGTPIRYTLNKTGECYDAHLIVMPVRGSTVSLKYPRHPYGIYNITGLVSVRPDQLADLFTNGRTTDERGEELRIFGHLTHASAPDVSVTRVGRDTQTREFSRVMGEIRDYERALKSEMIRQVNAGRHLRAEPRVNRFSECAKDELSRAFMVAQMHMGMADEKARETFGKVYPAPAADLLTSSLYLAEVHPDQFTEALINPPTSEVRRVRNILKTVFRKTTAELYARMGKDPADMSSDTIAALKTIWSNVLAMPDAQRVKLIGHLDRFFTDTLIARLGLPHDVVERALEIPEHLPQYIASELHKNKMDRFQEDHQRNEVVRAIERPFMQMLFLLGLNPDPTEPDDLNTQESRQLRGEILICLAEVFTAISVEKRRKEADNSYFEAALGTFLGRPRQEHIKINGSMVHSIMHRKTQVPVGGRFLDVVSDKRRLKSEESMTFKRFQAPEETILDDFGYNLGVEDGNFPDEQKNDVLMRLDLAEELEMSLLAHFQVRYAGSDVTVSVVPGTRKAGAFDLVREFLKLSTAKQKEQFFENMHRRGRPGSLGALLVRLKFVVCFADSKGKHYTEVSIWPLQSSKYPALAGTPFVTNVFDKLADGARYEAERLFLPPANDPTAPSLIELIEPSVWVPERFEIFRAAQRSLRG